MVVAVVPSSSLLSPSLVAAPWLASTPALPHAVGSCGCAWAQASATAIASRGWGRGGTASTCRAGAVGLRPGCAITAVRWGVRTRCRALRWGACTFLAASALGCTAVAPMRREAARSFHCAPHRVQLRHETTMGDEPIDRGALRAQLREARRAHGGIETIAFVAQGCERRDRFLCHRIGPGHAFECGVMIR